MKNTHWNTGEVLKTIKDKLAGEVFDIEVSESMSDEETSIINFNFNQKRSFYIVGFDNNTPEPFDDTDDTNIEAVQMALLLPDECSREEEELFNKVRLIMKYDMGFEVTDDQEHYC